jgi:hypothetical protein
VAGLLLRFAARGSAVLARWGQLQRDCQLAPAPRRVRHSLRAVLVASSYPTSAKKKKQYGRLGL